MGYRDEEAALAVRRQNLEQRAEEVLAEIRAAQSLLVSRNVRLQQEGFDENVVRVPRLDRPAPPPDGAPAATLQAYATALETTLAGWERVRSELHQALQAPGRRGTTHDAKRYLRSLSVLGMFKRHYGKLLVVGLMGFSYWGCSPTLVGRRWSARWTGRPTPYRCGPNDDIWGSRIEGLRLDAKRMEGP